MAANEIKNANGGLSRIVFPNLDKPEFGQALAAQFKNIDLNFQKLGNLNLGKGEDGAGCTYINYNLNSIFFYWTGFSDPSGHREEIKDGENIGIYIEKQNFKGFYNFLKDPNKNPLYDRTMQLKNEVDADLQEFKDLTGGTEEDYVRMCAFLLFGQPMLFDHYKDTPETCSLFGALIAENGDSSTATIDGVGFSSMWLLDWWRAEPKLDVSASKTPVYTQDDARVKLFLTHMQLFDPGRITVAVAPALDSDKYAVGNYKPVGSLAYVYLDPRYRNHGVGNEVEDVDQWVNSPEISCVLYWSPRPLGHMHITSNDGSWDDHICTGGFKVVNLFPQMYFDGSGFYWKVNGTETRIPVTGRPGTDGKNSQFVVVERIGNIMGAVYNKNGYDDQSKLWGPWPLKKPVTYREWMGKEQLIRTVHSGRAARNLDNSAYESVNNWVSDRINVHFDRTKSDNEFTTTNHVTSAKVNAENGWLVDSKGFNSTEILHLYRIWGIVGREKFWRVKTDKNYATVTERPFRTTDPSYSKYNYGVDDAIEIDSEGSTQAQMMALDGAPCIVVADPAYIYDRTNTTIWFSTLKAVKATSDKDSNTIMLVAYCGDENQMTTEIDDHGMAGIMQHLDAYSYKSTGSNRNKPRGLMLPIGSAEATEADLPSDIYGSHIIHSDLGGFLEREKDDVSGGYYGVPVTPDQVKNQNDINGDTMRANNKQNNMPLDVLKDSQFVEVIGKRFMHIGSVDDFRTLDYVPSAQNNPASYSPATPGRRTDHTFLKAGMSGKNPLTPYGTAGFFGTNKGNWFKGSELHVDEPVTITRYRDLQRKGTLLTVEGDAVIGPHKHVNFTNEYLHNRRDGGLIVQSTLTRELIDKDDFWGKNTIFDKRFGTGLIPQFRKFARDLRGGAYNNNSWNETLVRTRIIGDVRFSNGWLGAWDTVGAANEYDSVSNISDKYDASARASILADDMIGARMVMALDGMAVIDQFAKDEDGAQTNDMTVFSVDRKGNMQTLGSEVRSNSQDTFWAFHTRWRYEGQVFPGRGFHAGIGGWVPMINTNYQSTVATTNKLMFGTSHGLYNMLFAHDNRGNNELGYHHWRAVNKTNSVDANTVDNAKLTDNYLWYEENGLVGSHRVPAQLAAGYVTNIGYSRQVGLNQDSQNTAEQFGTAFNTNPDLRFFPGEKNKDDMLPYITRMWCDLLYQEGALAVKGVHFMPVNTDFMGDFYYGRYGVNTEYGIIIGHSGASVSVGEDEYNIGDNEDTDEPKSLAFNPKPLNVRYTAHKDGETTILGTYDTLGSYVVKVDGEGKPILDNNQKPTILETWHDGDINMFESRDPAMTHVGLWSQPSILTESSILAQKDLWVGRVASIRGQIRAKSFRRHINSWTDDSDWAFMLDNGMSSYNAPKHINIEIDEKGKDHTQGCDYTCNGFKPNNQTPLVLDLGYVYGKRRLVRFGTIGSVNLDPDNKLELGSEVNDREICLLGKMPNDTCSAYGSFKSLFGNSTYNPGHWVLYNSNGIVTVLVKVQLNYTSKAGKHRTWFRGNSQYRAYGIKLPDSKEGDYGSTPGRKAMLSIPIKCDGLVESFRKADIPVEWLPKDDIFVDSHVEGLRGTSTNEGKGAKIFGGNDAAAWDSTGRGGYGITFRLAGSTNDGLELQVARAFAPALMVSKPNQYLTFSFTYPTAAALETAEFDPIPDMDIWPEREVYYLCKKLQGYVDVEDEETGEKYKDFERNDEGQLKASPIEQLGDIFGVYGGTTEATWDWFEDKTTKEKTRVFNNNNPVLETDTNALRRSMYYLFSDEYEYDGDEDKGILGTFETMMNLVKNDPNIFYLIRGTYAGGESLGGNCWQNGKYQKLEWEIIATKSQLDEAANGGKYAQNTKDGILSRKKNSGEKSFFELIDGTKNVPDGVFRPMGAFVQDTANENGYIATTNGKPESFNPFSVQYWEEGGTSFLRLTIACDKHWSGQRNKIFSQAWGIWVPEEKDATHELKFYDLPTNAYLPKGAKLPSCAVRANLVGSGQQWSYWKDNRPMRGSGICRLDTDGRVTFERLINPFGLATSWDDNDVLQVVSMVFEYKSSDKVMEKNYYTEIAGDDDSEKLPDIGGGTGGTTDNEPEGNLLWDKTEEPTNASLLQWLQGAGRTELLTVVEASDEEASTGTVESYTSAYGDATIRKDADGARVSIICSAYKEGTDDWSHRSISFTYHAGTISKLSSYIIGNAESNTEIDGLVTNVFGGTYNGMTGYNIFCNGFINHATAAKSDAIEGDGQNPNDRLVIEQVFKLAKVEKPGCDVAKIGSEVNAHWQNYKFANGEMSLALQDSTTLKGIGYFNYYSSGKLKRCTGKWLITGKFDDTTIRVDYFVIHPDPDIVGAAGGGESYDDSALKTRISALETKLANLAMLVPQNVTINMAADQTEAQIQVQAINADGNEITLNSNNLQITNDSSVTVS